MQIESLSTARCKRIFLEKDREKGKKRLQLAECLKTLHEGDTLIVWRLECLAGSTSDLVLIANQLQDRGVRFISLSESIDTQKVVSRLAIHFFTILADFELNLLRERTRQGLARARSQGRVGGRVSTITRQEDLEMVRLCESGEFTQVEIAQMVGLSLSTLQRRLRAHTARKGRALETGDKSI